MTTSPDPVAAPADGEKAPTCRFPGCTRPPRPTPATGRPTQYCEQADPDGPVHTAANAWKARNKAQRGRTVTVTEGGQVARPVSMARLTLQDQLEELPARLTALTTFLADLESNLATTRDVEAIAAEVDQVNADRLAETAEADRLRSLAERRAREAEADKAEADDAARAAEEARRRADDEIARVRAECAAAIESAKEQARQDVHAAEQAARQEIEQARAEAAARVTSAEQAARAEVTQVREDTAAQVSAAGARAQAATLAATRADTEAQTARDRAAALDANITALQEELRNTRAAAREDLARERVTSRQDLERRDAAHAAELEHVRHDAEERVATLRASLDASQAALDAVTRR